MRGSGITTVATKGSGDPIRKDTAKTAYAKVTIPNYEGFTFEAQRWWRHYSNSDSAKHKPAPEPDLPDGAGLVWCLSIGGKSIVWADTKPLAIQQAKEWLDACGGPDWLEARLGFPHRGEVEASMRVREGDHEWNENVCMA